MCYQLLSPCLPIHPRQLKNTPLRARHAKQRGRCDSLTSSKTQRGWSSKVRACLCARPSSSGTCLVGLGPRALISMTWYAVKYPASTPSPTPHILSSRTSSLKPASSQAVFNLISHIHLFFLFFLLFFLCFSLLSLKRGFLPCSASPALHRPNLLLEL